jgi:prolycopene isomerase
MAELDKGLSPWMKPMFPLRFKTLWSIRDKTLGDVLAEHLSDPRLKAVLGQSWGYYGLPPSKLSAFYYLLPAGQYLEYGGDYLKGTSQSLSNALAGVVRAGGGEVLCNARVESIILDNGRAVGVKTEDGREFRGKAVVCNASALQMAGKLLPPGALPGETRARLDKSKPSLSTFIVWLGLNRDITKDFPQACASFYPGQDLEQAYQACLAGDMGKSGLTLVAYDHLVPGFSPAGRGSLTILSLCGYGPWQGFEADYLAGRKEAYRVEKERLTRLMIGQAEKLALPGLSGLIKMRESATPLTNLRYTGNTAGAIYGFDQTPDNSFMTRLPNKTGLPGLFLAGAWGNPGGGFTGALLGGKNAFKDLVESWG